MALGSIGLYICKVAQSNILPDNLEQTPFGPHSRIPQHIPININVMEKFPFHGLKFWATPEEITSQKAVFNNKDFLATYMNGLVGSLNKKASGHSNIVLYYSQVINDCIVWNNWFISYVFNFLNEYLPEWTIITVFGYLLLGVLLPAFMTMNFVISIVAHVMNFPQMFRRKMGSSGLIPWFLGIKTTNKKWESEEDIDYFSFNSFPYWFWACLWGYPIFLISTIVMPPVLSIYSILSPLFATYSIVGDNTNKNKPNRFVEFIKSLFSSKTVLLKILITLALFHALFKNLKGEMIVIGATIIAIIFSAITLNLYQTRIDTTNGHTNGRVPYTQALLTTSLSR